MEARATTRGELRVYLGAAPGVGKTFAMLEEGRRRAERGTDVVVALVETHGRAKTAEAVGDLEVVPRRTVSYRGLTLTELDLPAVLARRPAVALVDELAHTIAIDDTVTPKGPGHAKRWQDVEALLQHGIDVITTVNIQHLESLNDVVAAITGIRQTETVPDHVVRAADAVELVDMSPQALRRRMAHGNIYPPAKVDAALAQYFREGNLAALRELALLWLADRVDEGLERYRESHGIAATWATRERVVVGVSGGPESVNMMRRAARIASRSAGGEWLAVYVSRNDGLRAIAPDRLEQLRTTAHDLGGEFRAAVARDPAEGLLDLARGVNATQVLVGASRRSRLSTLLRPGVGETVIAESGDIDVHVVTHPYARRSGKDRARTTVGPRRQVAGYLMAVLGTAALAGLLVATPELHGLPTESLLMMALVVGTALVGGLWPAMVGAVLASLALNFFLVPPTRTLTVADPEDFVALVVFLLTGVAVALVVDAAARSTEQARRARAEAGALSVLAHSLLHVGDSPTAVLEQAARTLDMAGAAVLRTDADGRTDVEASWGDAPEASETADVTATIEPGAVLALRGRPLPAADQSLLTAYTAHLAVIADRQRAAAESRRAAELAEGNRIRTALLAAVSHDLRSPLAAIKAAASSLRSDVAFSAEDERELLATIEESADRLDALVGNLLDLSRLQSGAVNPLLTDLDVASAVSAALDGLPEADRVEVALPPDLPTAQADPGLLDRVLANLVENALRHAGPEAPVTVSGSTFTDEQQRRWVSVRIADRGRGVPARLKTAMFEPFQRLDDVPNGNGLGLGLAVAKGLSDAMGGRLTAEDTPGGGLTMVVDLPGMTSVLVVDDDPAILRTLQINLRARGYAVQTARDGRTALAIVAEEWPDVVILDLGLPDLDGVAVLTELRSRSAVPVVVLSARSQSDDKVEALDLGADDYLTKPFGMEELLARIRTALRHSPLSAERPARVVTAGHLRLDIGEQTAYADDREVHLTPTEWRIVEVLTRQPGQLVRQTELLQEVWGPAYRRETNYLRVYLAQLRRKLEPQPAQPRYFLTEPGVGYRFVAAPSATPG